MGCLLETGVLGRLDQDPANGLPRIHLLETVRKAPGHVHSVALWTAKEGLFAPFWPLYTSQIHDLPEWSGLVQEVRKETQGPLTQEGARFTTVAKFLGRRFETPFEGIVHDPPRRHTDRSTGGPFAQEYTHIFEEVAGGRTRLTQVTEGEPGGFFRLAGPLLEMAGRRQFGADLDTLKDLLEARG